MPQASGVSQFRHAQSIDGGQRGPAGVEMSRPNCVGAQSASTPRLDGGSIRGVTNTLASRGWRPTRLLMRSTSALVFSAVLCIACGEHSHSPTTGPFPFTNVPAPAGGVAQFTFLPVPIAAGQSVTALGSLNPPGHVLPTDHIYFYDGDLSANHPGGSDVRDVIMPATGAVIFIIKPTGTDYKIVFRATENFFFYLD